MTSIAPSQVFKCLADETRLKLTLFIAACGEVCVGDLTHEVDENQPKVSRHLALLRNQNLLLGRRRGQWIYYRINPQLPEWVLAVIDQTKTAHSDELQAMTSNLRHTNKPDHHLLSQVP